MEDNCRICLCGDRHMHSINNTVFQEIWERLTKAKFDINDEKPFFVCYICYAQLRNAHQLMKRALKSEELLTTIKNIGSEHEQRRILLIASLAEDFAYKYTIAEAFQFECNEIQINSVEEIKRENEGGREGNIEEEKEIAIKEEEEEAFQLECNEIQRNSVEEIKRENEEGGEENNEEENEIVIKEEEGAHGRKRTFEEVPGNIKRIKLIQITKYRNPSSDSSCSKQLTVDLNLVIPKSEQINSEVCHTNAGNEICLSKNAETVPPTTAIQGRVEANCLNIRKHKVSDLSCHTCQHKCATKSELISHLRQHIGEKRYKCDLCDYKSSQKSTLNNHIKFIHTNERNFSCHICLYKFVTKDKLNIHLRKHTGEKPYRCDFCEYGFAQKGHLNKHVKTKHTNERNFSCHVCPYKCVTKSDLDIHIRKHTGEKPYKCDLCESRFSQKGNLIIHTKYKHTKEKDYSCHLCQYQCVTKRELNIHLLKHTGEKPYKCNLCECTFAQKGNLISHTKYKHTKEKDYSCDLCIFKCVTKSDLNVHLRKHTGEKPYKCDLCDYKSSRKSHMINHTKHIHTK